MAGERKHLGALRQPQLHLRRCYRSIRRRNIQQILSEAKAKIRRQPPSRRHLFRRRRRSHLKRQIRLLLLLRSTTATLVFLEREADAEKEASDFAPVEANGPAQEPAAGMLLLCQFSSNLTVLVNEEEENPSAQTGGGEPFQGQRGHSAPLLLGAKKRKAGNIRRFKHEPAPNQEDNSKRDPPLITKIIMPVNYRATVTDNVQQVSITLWALSCNNLLIAGEETSESHSIG